MASETTKHSAFIVGKAFTTQYYNVLHKVPADVHKFYRDGSKVSRAEGLSAPLETVTTMAGINDMVMSRDYLDACAEIKSVDSQESLGGGVLVVVTGSLSSQRQRRRNFVQTFFLAPQDPRGFYVLSDIFRFLDNDESEDEEVPGEERQGVMDERPAAEEEDGFQQPPAVVKHALVPGTANGIAEVPSDDALAPEHVVRDVAVDEASQQQPRAVQRIPDIAAGDGQQEAGQGPGSIPPLDNGTGGDHPAGGYGGEHLIPGGQQAGVEYDEEEQRAHVVREVSETSKETPESQHVPVQPPAPQLEPPPQVPPPLLQPAQAPDQPPAEPPASLAATPIHVGSVTNAPVPPAPGTPEASIPGVAAPVPAGAAPPASVPPPAPAPAAELATASVTTPASPAPAADDPSAPKRSYAYILQQQRAAAAAAAARGVSPSTSAPAVPASVPPPASSAPAAQPSGPVYPAQAATAGVPVPQLGPILPQPPIQATAGMVTAGAGGAAGILSAAPQGGPFYNQVLPSANGPDDGVPSADAEGEAARSVFIRNLPSGIRKAQIGEYFSKFGRVKVDDIQIRQNKVANPATVYAFVEFEEAASAKAAAEAGTIMVEGNLVRIEEKRASGNTAGAGPANRGGYRRPGDRRGDRPFRDGGRSRSGVGPGMTGGVPVGPMSNVPLRSNSASRAVPDAMRTGGVPGIPAASSRNAPGVSGAPTSLGDEAGQFRAQPGQEPAGFGGGAAVGGPMGPPGSVMGGRGIGQGPQRREGQYRGGMGAGRGPGPGAPATGGIPLQSGAPR